MGILCIAKEPDSGFYIKSLDNTLEALQKYVGGYIECVQLYGDVAVICNEEGRLLGMPMNCEIEGISFCGPILIVGTDGEDFADIPDEFLEDWDNYKDKEIWP